MADWRSWTGKNSQDWIWPKLFQITVCERSKNRVQYLNDKICCLDKVIIYLLASYNLILHNQHSIFCTFYTLSSLHSSPTIFLPAKNTRRNHWHRRTQSKDCSAQVLEWLSSFSPLKNFLALTLNWLNTRPWLGCRHTCCFRWNNLLNILSIRHQLSTKRISPYLGVINVIKESIGMKSRLFQLELRHLLYSSHDTSKHRSILTRFRLFIIFDVIGNSTQGLLWYWLDSG